MTIRELTASLESLAPLKYQESYDNSGLLVGDPTAAIKGVLLTLDVTEDVLTEAIEKGCNLVVSHHPIIFSGLKSLTGKNYVERIVIKAIQENIALYAIHTNLDNVEAGVNAKICERLGLINTRILSPKRELLRKLYTFCPIEHAEKVKAALFEAGAGTIGAYDACSFSTEGNGTFRGGEGTEPFLGEVGTHHVEKENRIEVIFPAYLEGRVLAALHAAHPYEEVAYDVVALSNTHPGIGSGMVGELAEPIGEQAFLEMLKKNMEAQLIRHTDLQDKTIRKVAVCGGSGSFLLPNAIAAEADVFVTADYKYHQFFDADNQIVIADIGHYETEHFTQELLYDYLKKQFENLSLVQSQINTNPIHYM